MYNYSSVRGCCACAGGTAIQASIQTRSHTDFCPLRPGKCISSLTEGMTIASKALAHKLKKLAWFGAIAARRGIPTYLIAHGGGLGDDLMCTAVLRELRKRGHRRLWMMTDRPGLFANNADADVVLAGDPFYLTLARRLGVRVVLPIYIQRDWVNDYDTPPGRHFIAAMCLKAGITGDVVLRPYIHLTENERAAGRIAGSQIAIQSSGLAARFPLRNKEWFPERFQEVVNSLADRYSFVQIGSPSDPPMQGAIDLRGRTTLRESAAILSQSLVFLGLSGFPMHLARAVDCRSVIVSGGRDDPSQTGYSCNENLTSDIPCAPCWRWNTCDYGHRCMDMIDSDTVVDAIQRQIERFGDPIAADHDHIP